MATWDLEPGCERVIMKGVQDMPVSGAGNLSPQEVARRAEDWYGARIDDRTTGKIKIFPADPAQSPVFISDRFSNGSDRSNALSWLRKAGIDVMHEPSKPETQNGKTERTNDMTIESSMNGHPTPAVLATPKPAGAVASHADYETVLGMLAEVEQRDQARRAEIAGLNRTVDSLCQRVEALDLQIAQNRAAVARMGKTVKDAERRWEAGGALPVDEAARAEAERAELTHRAIEMLESLPPAATMAAGSIAASLGMPEKGNLLGKLMAAAAKEQRVTVLKVGAQKLYRALPKQAKE
jgi:hypothetical protein